MKAHHATRGAERRLGAALAALLLTGAGAAPASVTVSRDGDRLDVEAQATPLSEVLDAVAAELGASVEYEGEPPRFPVTLALQDRTPAEAVLSLLDGTGVNYALQLDASGQGVVRLLIQAASGSRPARAQPARPTPTRRPPAQIPTPPRVPEFPQPFDPAADREGADEAPPEDPQAPDTGTPRPLTFPTPRPGRPAPAPLLFPEPLLPAAPTPTPPPQQP